MPFEIIRNDITNMSVDAIVNTANPEPLIGSGVDAGIHAKAGEGLIKARRRIGRIAVGDAAITRAFKLDAKYVIHTVGPQWCGGNENETELLRSCYDSALSLALKYRCRSIAFPLISSGNYGFPNDTALHTAIASISEFLMKHELQIYLVVFNNSTFELSEKLFKSVASYIDSNYAAKKLADESVENCKLPYAARRQHTAEKRMSAPYQDMDFSIQAAAVPVRSAVSLEVLLSKTDKGFSETLLKLIDRTGKKDSDIYKRANVDRKLFSKIRNNPSYKPSKATALAFAVALELDLEETKDLIGRAGYALSHSSKFDIIVEFFIMQKNYNIFELNEVLFAFDQPLIGA